MHPTRILLAVDDGPVSAPAVQWTAARARRGDVVIRVVSVATDDSDLRGSARAAVERAGAAIAAAAPEVPLSLETPGANVLDALVAASSEVDLMVVGGRPAHGIRSALHAGIPMALSGRLACDLLVVPVDAALEGSGPVVVGWGDPGAADAAVTAAAGEATRLGVPLRIVHVWDPVPLAHYDPAGGAELVAAVEESERLALDRTVREVRVRFPDLEVEGAVHIGPVAAGIRRHADDAGLIVVGSRHRSPLGEILFGATGDALITQGGRVPVLITRDPRLDD